MRKKQLCCYPLLAIHSNRYTLFTMSSIEMSPVPADAREWKAPKKEAEKHWENLNHDVLNPFSSVKGIAEYLDELKEDPSAADEMAEVVDTLQPLPTFEAYVRSLGHGDPEQKIRETDPNQVAEYDALVAEFNEDLPRMKAETDTAAMVDFVDRATKLVRSE